MGAVPTTPNFEFKCFRAKMLWRFDRNMHMPAINPFNISELHNSKNPEVLAVPSCSIPENSLIEPLQEMSKRFITPISINRHPTMILFEPLLECQGESPNTAPPTGVGS
jgi:hypothetical protein